MKCSKCGETDPTKFWKNQSYCKECYKKYRNIYTRTDNYKILAKGYQKKWNNSEKGKKYINEWKKLNGRESAYNKVKYALKRGYRPDTDAVFIKGECIHKDCNCFGPIQFHHTEGYNKPYTGVWVCQWHHLENYHSGEHIIGKGY